MGWAATATTRSFSTMTEAHLGILSFITAYYGSPSRACSGMCLLVTLDSCLPLRTISVVCSSRQDEVFPLLLCFESIVDKETIRQLAGDV